MGVKTHLSVNLPQSVSISRAEIDLTLLAVTTYVPCCNLAPSIVVDWDYCISCVVQQTSGVKDLSSLVRYDDSSLAAIRHVQSIVQPRPNIRSHSVLFFVILRSY